MHEKFGVTCHHKPPVAMQASDLTCRHSNLHTEEQNKSSAASSVLEVGRRYAEHVHACMYCSIRGVFMAGTSCIISQAQALL